MSKRTNRDQSADFHTSIIAKAAAGEATDHVEDAIIYEKFKESVEAETGSYNLTSIQILFETGLLWPRHAVAGYTPAERVVFFRLLCNLLITHQCGVVLVGPTLEAILNREPTARAYIGDKTYASLARLVLNYPSFIDTLRSDTGLPVVNLDEAARRAIEHDGGI